MMAPEEDIVSTRDIFIRTKQHTWPILTFICGVVLTLTIAVPLIVSKYTSSKKDEKTDYACSLRFDRKSTHSLLFLSDDNTVMANSFSEETPNVVNHPEQFNTYKGTIGDKCLTNTSKIYFEINFSYEILSSFYNSSSRLLVVEVGVTSRKEIDNQFYAGNIGLSFLIHNCFSHICLSAMSMTNTWEHIKVIGLGNTAGTAATGRLGFFINMNQREFSVIDKDTMEILYTLKKVESADQLCLAFANTSELVSNFNKGASLKRPLDSDSSNKESVKKLRSDDSHSIATKVCSNTDMSDLKHLVYSLTQSMNTMHISLTERIDTLEKNMSKDLAQLIEQKVKHEVSQAKKEINGKLSSFKDQVNVLEGKVNSMEQSYASVVKQPSVNDEKKLNIVIKGLPHGKNEENNPQCTLNKVNSLIRDGLKLSNIKFLKAERKVSRDSKPGLIIAKVQSLEDKKSIMKAKSKLKGNKSFSSVYIENDIPWEVRSQQNNLRTILKEIGKSDKYRVVGSKIVRNQRDGTDGK
ncbi:Hypothetical predicted protein [Mytilus galloprovincialis]|uniref:SPRY-associated domain-containing protein n=1 Tax=Mytilus galloprovincialis TaxID=29158 RepID=A0A8B6BSD7_MYTGA|nr:Hypothetical predicted protein [Mytilus galloprovincialis]